MAKVLPTIHGPTFQERPLFCDEEPTFRFRKIKTIADFVVAEIDAVDPFRQFFRETHTHPGVKPCNPKSHSTQKTLLEEGHP